MGTAILAWILLSSALQADFDSFSFCRARPVVAGELQCVRLSPSGEGVLRLDFEDEDPLEQPFQLSPSAAGTFVDLVKATDNLRDGDRYESDRNVASLGIKTLVVEGDWGRREAEFNYSSRREVTDLVSFFDGLIAQELLMMDIELARRFDPLSMPENLERLEQELRRGRLVDLPRFVPILEGIAEDSRLLILARNQAAALKEEIEKEYR